MMLSRLFIGVDPGVETGIAIWRPDDQIFDAVKSCSIIEAMEMVMSRSETNHLTIVFEDARLRRWFGKAGREQLQGAGSIKRDCSIWEEFCDHHGIGYIQVPPAANRTKTKAELFRAITNWTGRTNEHARDAAMLVFGRR